MEISKNTGKYLGIKQLAADAVAYKNNFNKYLDGKTRLDGAKINQMLEMYNNIDFFFGEY